MALHHSPYPTWRRSNGLGHLSEKASRSLLGRCLTDKLRCPWGCRPSWNSDVLRSLALR